MKTDASSPCPNCGQPLGPAEDVCPQCGVTFTLVEDDPTAWRFDSLPEMRYQNAYVWLILVSALDLMLTFLVVVVWPDGYELNPIAAAVLDVKGMGGGIVFKFAMIMLVIVLCEVIGRRSDRAGRRISRLAVAINAGAVLYTLLLLIRSPLGN